MKVSGKIILLMVKELSPLRVEINMLVTGWRARRQVLRTIDVLLLYCCTVLIYVLLSSQCCCNCHQVLVN